MQAVVYLETKNKVASVYFIQLVQIYKEWEDQVLCRQLIKRHLIVGQSFLKILLAATIYSINNTVNMNE
jgi:hypothetical protein